MPNGTQSPVLTVEDVTGRADDPVIEADELDLLESIATLGIDVRVWR